MVRLFLVLSLTLGLTTCSIDFYQTFIQATLDNAMSPHSVNMQALENVRESIAMLESQAGLSTELRGDQEDVSMESLRRDDAKRRDQEALQALKMEL